MVHRILAALGWHARSAATTLFVPCALTLALVGAPSTASAFCRTTTCGSKRLPASCGDVATLRDSEGCLTRGAPLIWEQPCVSFSIQRLGSSQLPMDYDTLEGVINQAFSVWQDAWCGEAHPSITAISLGRLECNRREFNSTGPNANGVFFIDENWPHNPDAIALTTVSFDPETGKIYGADMEINTGEYPLTAESLAFVVTHEAGHFFGLDHSRLDDAVMFARYSVFDAEPTAQPVLTPDDIAAICAVYPPGRASTGACEPEPERGYATDCGGNVVGTCAAAAVGQRRPAPAGLLAMASALGLIGLLRGRRSSGRGKLLVVPQERV